MASSAIHGRGVFSYKALKPGELIEEAPLIPISKPEKEHLKYTSLYHYYFIVQNRKTPIVIGLGYSSLYNHSCPANASYKVNIKRKLIEIKAVIAIAANEEIFINYNGNPDDESPVVFSTFSK